ncbi:MAG: 2-amino-4-hydroxy-6-hydroxymethyldihydropteridine diphosphokinase [Clostridia bacterium]|nr:2-amino-4-hydroxy-6-hydroxymethyldihydropteridine diphosphokinase [Clostridia bacterium]
MSNAAYLALGSNIGDREKNLAEAVKHIADLPETWVEGVSAIYETDPVGFIEQDQFLNMVIKVKTRYPPLGLLEQLQKIELRMKRTRLIRWGPRTMDIDILLYGNEHIQLPELVVPHPRMFERAFVLIPLRDVVDSPEVMGKNIKYLIEQCEDKNGVKLYRGKKERG